MGTNEAQTPQPVRDRVADRVMLAGVAERLLGPQPTTTPKIGRFLIIDEIGSGGMGQVFCAYDPELDRRIALKVLRSGPGAGAQSTARLQAEAMAMAKLSHPNVVPIFEVGLASEELFLAMELVEGADLDKWSRENRPAEDLREDDRMHRALDLLLQAGRGLAAAHGAGLVHRDFKPSNVLVGSDGRVRVADFGLATSGARPAGGAARTPRESAVTGSLTATGELLGTPRYMPPEHRRSGIADERSDQFAFCVAAWEVLFGAHPWLGGPPDEERPERPEGAPAWLADPLLRGLEPDPAARYSSMADLLTAITPASSGGASAWRFAAAAAVLGVTVTAGVGLLGDEPSPCAELEVELRGVWDDTEKVAVQTAMLGSDLPYAEAAWARVGETLDAYASRWLEQRTEVCEANQSGESSTSAQTLGCLAQRRRALSAFVEIVAAGSPEAISNASVNAAELPAVELCGEIDYVLHGFEAPSEGDAARVEDAQTQLAKARALRRAGKYRPAKEALAAIDDDVRDLDFLPLLQDYALERAEIASYHSDYRVEEEALLEAYNAATRSGTKSLAIETSSRLATTLASRGELEAGRRWLGVAEAADDGGSDPLVGANLHRRRGDALLFEGDAEAAVPEYTKALEARERLFGEGSPRLVTPLTNLGVALHRAGEYDEARATLERSLGLARELGPQHPAAGGVLHGLGAIAHELDDYATVRRLAEEELALYLATYGPDHPVTAMALVSLGDGLGGVGKLSEALEPLERADAIYAEAGSEFRRDHVYALHALSAVYVKLGRRDEAVAHTERAFEILLAILPESHPDVAAGAASLAFAKMQQGDAEGALVMFTEARDRLARSMGPEHFDLATVLGGLGASLTYLDRYAEAKPVFARQLEVIEANVGAEHPIRAQPLYNLGLCAEGEKDFDAAAKFYEDSLAALEVAVEPDDPSLAYPLIGLARVHVASEQAAQAVEAGERALGLLADGDVKIRADARAVLAQGLWMAGEDRKRARELADAAVLEYGTIGAEADQALKKFEEWRTKNRL